MAQIQAEIKRGFLRQIAEGAKRNGVTLREALLAFQAQIFTPNFQRGRILLNTSGSGQSGSFEISAGQFRPEQIFALSEEFIAVHDDVASPADSGDPNAVDTLFTAMCADGRLHPCRELHGDFSGLNYP